MMRFTAKNSLICELITLLRANQIAGIASDFKMDIINIYGKSALSWIAQLVFIIIYNPVDSAQHASFEQPGSAFEVQY